MYSPFLYQRIKKFTDTYGLGIGNLIKGTGLFFPAVVAQSAYESGYGERIPQGSNNFGGIKYNPRLEGVVGYVETDTVEYVRGKRVVMKQRFAKFKDVESGFRGHVRVLMLDRYKDARLLAKTPEEQLFMIAKAGYSTKNPRAYANALKPLVQAVTDYKKIGRIA